jgi:hypothetical protein
MRERMRAGFALELLWYLPFRFDLQIFELFISFVILVLLALREKPIGLAIYALAWPLARLASDGSNDTSCGLLLLAAMALVPRNPAIGGSVGRRGFVQGLRRRLAGPPGTLARSPERQVFVLMNLVVWAPVYLLWGVTGFWDSLNAGMFYIALRIPW